MGAPTTREGWELRASTSLAKLWKGQGKRRDARELLAPVHAWFIEGFDTKDLKEAGALTVYACATHGLFNGPALERIAESEIDRLIVTDTVAIDPLTKPDNVEVLTVAGILAETIQNVFSDDSVSAIFAGENQLF